MTTKATMPRHFWIHDVTLGALRGGAEAAWLVERFGERMRIWFNAGETVDGAIEMILFTAKQEPIETRGEDELARLRAFARAANEAERADTCLCKFAIAEPGVHDPRCRKAVQS